MRVGFPIRIMAAAAVLALGLVGLVVREGAARDQGREVVVDITGYDPRELLTGHYVQFQFRSEFPTGTPCPPLPASPRRRSRCCRCRCAAWLRAASRGATARAPC